MFKPMTIDSVKSIFEYMPKMEDIPEECKLSYGGSEHVQKMRKLFSDWFYCGLKSLEFMPKKEIDKDKAVRHIRSVMGSFEPRHEDKTAACVYMLSEWFEDITWVAKKLAL